MNHEDPLDRPVSGCHALHGCSVKESCLRYRLAREYPFVGFHGHHLCRTEDRPFYLPDVAESA